MQEQEHVFARRAGTRGVTTAIDSVSRSGSSTSPSRYCRCRRSAERTRRSVAVVQAAVSCCSQSTLNTLRRPSTTFYARRCRIPRFQLTCIPRRLKTTKRRRILSINRYRHNNIRGTEICTAPHRKKLASETLRYGSHSFYAANTPYLSLPRKRLPDDATTD